MLPLRKITRRCAADAPWQLAAAPDEAVEVVRTARGWAEVRRLDDGAVGAVPEAALARPPRGRAQIRLAFDDDVFDFIIVRARQTNSS